MSLSSEAQWVALSDTVPKVMTMIQLLRSMKISTKPSVMILLKTWEAYLHQVASLPHPIPSIWILCMYVNAHVEDGIEKY